MKIISHRGWWNELGERNLRSAFVRSFDNGLGTETDLRDVCGRIVISHDMPRGDEITFEEVLQIMDGRNLPLALNIKADGQVAEILRLLKKYGHTNYFTFDMSIPDMVVQTAAGGRVFTGWSDILNPPVMLDRCAGVWLDTFFSSWWTPGTIDGLLEQGKAVCVVSEDLHKRPNEEQWAMLRQCRLFASDELILCTDRPSEALQYFGVSV